MKSILCLVPAKTCQKRDSRIFRKLFITEPFMDGEKLYSVLRLQNNEMNDNKNSLIKWEELVPKVLKKILIIRWTCKIYIYFSALIHTISKISLIYKGNLIGFFWHSGNTVCFNVRFIMLQFCKFCCCLN
jgi:hypothetical protein